MQDKIGEDVFICPLCPHETRHRMFLCDLREHIAEKHLDNFYTYFCPQCKEKFATPLKAHRHIREECKLEGYISMQQYTQALLSYDITYLERLNHLESAAIFKYVQACVKPPVATATTASQTIAKIKKPVSTPPTTNQTQNQQPKNDASNSSPVKHSQPTDSTVSPYRSHPRSNQTNYAQTDSNKRDSQTSKLLYSSQQIHQATISENAEPERYQKNLDVYSQKPETFRRSRQSMNNSSSNTDWQQKTPKEEPLSDNEETFTAPPYQNGMDTPMSPDPNQDETPTCQPSFENPPASPKDKNGSENSFAFKNSTNGVTTSKRTFENAPVQDQNDMDTTASSEDSVDDSPTFQSGFEKPSGFLESQNNMEKLLSSENFRNEFPTYETTFGNPQASLQVLNETFENDNVPPYFADESAEDKENEKDEDDLPKDENSNKEAKLKNPALDLVSAVDDSGVESTGSYSRADDLLHSDASSVGRPSLDETLTEEQRMTIKKEPLGEDEFMENGCSASDSGDHENEPNCPEEEQEDSKVNVFVEAGDQQANVVLKGVKREVQSENIPESKPVIFNGPKIPENSNLNENHGPNEAGFSDMKEVDCDENSEGFRSRKGSRKSKEGNSPHSEKILPAMRKRKSNMEELEAMSPSSTAERQNYPAKRRMESLEKRIVLESNYKRVVRSYHVCEYISCCDPKSSAECIFCRGSHHSEDCASFSTLYNRKQQAFVQGLCKRCGSGHKYKPSCEGVKCSICGKFGHNGAFCFSHESKEHMRKVEALNFGRWLPNIPELDRIREERIKTEKKRLHEGEEKNKMIELKKRKRSFL